MKYLLLLSLLAVNLFAGIRTIDITPSDNNGSTQSIRILDQKVLNYSVIDGLKFSEISDVAYWAKAQKLFMISDEGKLFVFHVRFGEKIEELEAIEAANLTKKGGKAFKKWAKDSEGMTIDAKGRLLISFEGKAKIGRFHKNSDKIGQRIKKYTIPALLQNPKNYRSRNKSLEALAWHPEYGILTVAEWPLKQDDKKQQTVYALNGKKWHFKAEPERRSAVSAIEVMESGDLLVLERSYTGLTNPFVVTLKRVYLKNCKKGMCRTEVLAKMNTHKGWSVDNFEGLARVGKNRYVMVSDDNDNFFQRTLLIYFEVKE
ncbi:esterase-like activity of phytase family protein [Sulfurovum sp. ST-21]|uniref:Esterase-like activity of phytase family protein n=1 Tax=Sulfurovum indicum TaxID=2779528 RepID=A0A7M1S643_9BACT|nr:esterase-like activity of phytase family protein [Sulfurovum indicum]QOR61840.1 esterase-like activity of phytase family protein [Sulfurovum indicum]